MKIAAGVLHYKNWPDVRPGIDRLLQQTRVPDGVLVFDHASQDGSVEQLRAAYPDIEIYEAPVNRGPAAGENAMLQLLVSRGYDAVMPLPDDLELSPDAIEILEARLEEAPHVGAVGPLIALKEDRERVFSAGGIVHHDKWRLDFRHDPALLVDWEGQPPREADFLQTGGVLMRSEAIRQVGEVALHFYYWNDDIDYTMRFAKAGWKLECVPAAIGWQEFGAPGPYVRTRNSLLLVARNAPRRIVARELMRQIWLLARDTVRRPEAARGQLYPRFRGIADFCLRRFGPPPAGVSR